MGDSRLAVHGNHQTLTGQSEVDSECDVILCRDCDHPIMDHKMTEHGVIIETHLQNRQVVKRFMEDAGFDYQCRICGRDCTNYLT